MLHAFIIACGLMGGEVQCGTFTDTFGPYTEKAKCEERLAAMEPFARVQVYKHLGPAAKYDAMCGTIEEILVRHPQIKGTPIDPRKTMGQEA